MSKIKGAVHPADTTGSSLVLWLVVFVACLAMAILCMHGMVRVTSPLSQYLVVASINVFFSYLLLYLPLRWLFSSGRIHGAIRVLILALGSTLAAILFVDLQLHICLWASVMIVSMLSLLPFTQFEVTKRPRNAYLAATSILLAVGLFKLLIAFSPPSELRRLVELRVEFPVVDIGYRIEKLKKQERSQAALAKEAAEMQQSLQTFYDGEDAALSFPFRDRLKLIHDAQFEQFVRSPQFGVGRLNRREVRYVEERRHWGHVNVSEDTPLSRWPFVAIHLNSFIDFLDPTTLGEKMETNQYLRFKSHRIAIKPRSIEAPKTYTLERLELIGLLLHEGPVVYVTHDLPDMSTISSGEITTRAMSSFESDALVRILGGESLVVENEGENLRMVGALRAIDQCIDCHQVKSGELLGAFSYEYRLKQRGRVR
ncbi:MAG: hypothetical protein JNL67_17785 [Planctomycetaceae bacterium]|nr:hypothetical protein [Planctomycetaceae bacterium]